MLAEEQDTANSARVGDSFRRWVPMVVVLFAILYVFVRGTFGNGARDIDTV
jgi:hypothetical protein